MIFMVGLSFPSLVEIKSNPILKDDILSKTDWIESFDECSHFLSIYLEEAKQTEMELRCEYEAYIWD